MRTCPGPPWTGSGVERLSGVTSLELLPQRAITAPTSAAVADLPGISARSAA